MSTRSISIIKERRTGELRALLLPAQVNELVRSGFDVLVEHDLGAGVGVSDVAYRDAGGIIVDTEAAWNAELVLKYKAPLRDEFRFFRAGMHLAAFMHAEGDPELIRALCERQVSAFAFEFIRTEYGTLVAVSDTEIAGKLAVIYAAYHLQSHLGGRGILLAGIQQVARPKVIVIGHGNAGGAAARMALALGADVVVFGTNETQLKEFEKSLAHQVRCRINTPETLEDEIRSADVVIGAILISSYDTKVVVDHKLLRQMRRGSILIDVTCGYGAGYLPTFERLTNFQSPVMEVEGVLHIKIDGLPASVPITASTATSAILIQSIKELADHVFANKPAERMVATKLTAAGRIVHPEVIRQEHLRKRFQQMKANMVD